MAKSGQLNFFLLNQKQFHPSIDRVCMVMIFVNKKKKKKKKKKLLYRSALVKIKEAFLTLPPIYSNSNLFLTFVKRFKGNKQGKQGNYLFIYLFFSFGSKLNRFTKH